MEGVELVLDAKAELGEGPLWDHRRRVLYWVDITAGRIHVYDPYTGKDRIIDTGEPVGCVTPRMNGDLLMAMKNGFASLDVESAVIRRLIDPEKHLPANRFNDGKCDPRGRFWAGTMSLKGQKGAGSLYCLYPDLTVRTMLSGVTTSNGLAWSADQKKLFYIDTGTGNVSVFAYDAESGDIGHRRKLISIPSNEGKPDGMTIDEAGMLWVAHWGGGRVSRWNPKDGKRIASLEIPAPNVTSCTFGGSHFDELYITTARGPLSDDQLEKYPQAGGLFRAKPGVRGLRQSVFAG